MKKLALYLSCSALALASCKKDFLNTAPTSGTFTEQQARDLQGTPAAAMRLADASVKGIYAFMRQYNTLGESTHDDFGQKAVDLGLDLMTQDMVQSKHHWFGFDYIADNREANYRRVRFLWNFYYKIIYNANSILDKIDPNTTDQQLKYIQGQALALRGYAYHYLAQLFQKTYKGNESAKGVPIYTTAASMEGKPRAPLSEVYNQIVQDLTQAATLLQGFTRTSKEQINQNVANGMLARVYLSMENWPAAEAAARAARTGLSLMSEAQYKAGFSELSNPEWMWGSEITSQTTTIYASFFSHMDNTTPGYAGALAVYKLISKNLYDQIPLTDVRKSVYKDPAATINTNLPAYAQLKFRDPGGFTGDYVYMRAAEMYLIEAEALARQGKTAEAAQVLYELVSKRDPAYVLSVNVGQSLIDEILLQKRIELWGEGLTFLDLKRLNMSIDRTGSNHRSDATFVIPAGDPKFTYKIPLKELEANPNIPESDQNP